MFLQVCVCPQGGGGACIAGGMCGRGHAWQGACMVGRHVGGGGYGRGDVWLGGGHAWLGACMVGGVHGGACMAGGICGGGMRDRGACMV